jgi:hypothetical protein
MLGTGRMADIHVLNFSSAINQQGIRVVLKKSVRRQWIKMQHLTSDNK